MLRRYGAPWVALGMALLAAGLGGCGTSRSAGAGARLDRTAPRVELLQPQIRYRTRAARPAVRSRGFSVVRKAEPITVSGRVTDTTGVAQLVVNGQEVPVDSRGQFSLQVPLVSGENTLRIQAKDTYNNASDITFTIVVDN